LKKPAVPKRKKVQNKVKTTVEEKIFPHLKENAFEKTLLYCQNEVKSFLKNTSVPKRNKFKKKKNVDVPKGKKV
tara:strand:+ start:204 stop:425 length:222 start_codon:yes stop_codon:yes gene_type:complete